MDSIRNCQIFSALKKKHDDTEADNNSNGEREYSSILHSPKLLPNIPMNKTKQFSLLATISLLIIIVITFISPWNSEKKGIDEPMCIPHGLILMSDDNQIWTVNPLDKSHRVLRQLDGSINTFDTYRISTNGISMVWIENFTSVNFNSKEYSNVEILRKIKPQAVAMDPITGKLYILDKYAETLNIIDLRHNYTGVVISDLIAPHDILLDLSHGLIFILQLSHSIIRGNMDGTWTEAIVRNAKISAIAINCRSRRIYWAKSSGGIESSNYEGKSIKTWTQVSSDVLALAIFDNQMFYLSPSNKSNHSILHSCIIHGESCEKHSKSELSFHSKIMKATSDQYLDLIKNPCENENGGCEQMCLLNLNGGRSCACSISWALNDDSRSCDRIQNFLLYSDENYFRGKQIVFRKDTFTDVIFPVRFSIEHLINKQTIDFDVSWLPEQIFFSDDYSIYSLHIHDSSQTKIYTIHGNFFINSLAADHSSKNLYYSKVSVFTKYYSIQVLTVKKGEIFRKTIFSSSEQSKPFNLLIGGNSLYFTGKTNKSIIQTSLDGIILKDIIYEDSNGLFDFSDDYWPGIRMPLGYGLWYITEPISPFIVLRFEYIFSSVCSWKFSISNLTRINKYRNHMFLKNLTSVWRSNSCEEPFQKIIPRIEDSTRKISDIKVVNFHFNKVNSNNECSINNGDCEQFCFAYPRKTCGCKDHSDLIVNNWCT